MKIESPNGHADVLSREGHRWKMKQTSITVKSAESIVSIIIVQAESTGQTSQSCLEEKRESEASAARVRIRIWVSIASAADVRRKGDAKMGGRRPVLVHMLKATQSEPHRTRGLVWESDLGRMSVK